MKLYIKHLFTCSIIGLSLSYCKAQKKYTAGLITANKKTYAVKEIENMVSVANISNRYTNEGMGKHYHGKFKGKVYPEMIGTTIDENKLKTILREEIGSNNISA